MNAGRELDALIAEKVMGWNWVNVFSNALMIVPPIGDKLRHAHKYVDKGIPDNMPHYSTNIADAWLVVEKLKGMGFGVTINEVCKRSGFYKYNDNVLGYWHCNFTVSDKDDNDKLLKTNPEIAETAPLAICLAALKACGDEVDG